MPPRRNAETSPSRPTRARPFRKSPQSSARGKPELGHGGDHLVAILCELPGRRARRIAADEDHRRDLIRLRTGKGPPRPRFFVTGTRGVDGMGGGWSWPLRVMTDRRLADAERRLVLFHRRPGGRFFRRERAQLVRGEIMMIRPLVPQCSVSPPRLSPTGRLAAGAGGRAP